MNFPGKNAVLAVTESLDIFHIGLMIISIGLLLVIFFLTNKIRRNRVIQEPVLVTTEMVAGATELLFEGDLEHPGVKKKRKTLDGFLVKNSVINFAGQVIPLIAAFIAIPILIRELGVDRFGAITLAWMLIGYFSVFDMGLSRTVAHIASQKLSEGKENEIPILACTALFLMAILGGSGAVLLSVGGWFFVHLVPSFPSHLISEIQVSLLSIGVVLPFVILTSGIVGLLQAYQKFLVINFIRIPMGLFSYLAPLAVIPFTNNLAVLIATLSAGRLISFLAHALAVRRVIPGIYSEGKVDRKLFKTLLTFGGWLTVSNVVAPIMLYMDRFIVGSFVALSAVSYYTTPFEVVTKLLIIPTSVMGVFFPAFSASFHKDRKQAKFLYHQVIKYISLILLPICFVIFYGAKWGLTFWLDDPGFAEASYQVAQLFVIGVFFNSLAQPSFNLIQAAGRPDLTAKLHLLELPFYLSYLWYFVDELGILGAAIAWVIRVFLSSVILFILAHKQLKKGGYLKHEKS